MGDDGVEPCEDIWETCIKKGMTDIIYWSLQCVMDNVQHRKNSAELYGYDFMCSEGEDGKPGVWLIEVNSSPACDYSTRITTPLVKKCMEDTVKVLVDLKNNPGETDTGEWELLHHPSEKRIVGRPCSLDKMEV